MIEALNSRYIPEPNSGCWLWLGSVSPKGYGVFRKKRAHRLMFEETCGAIPVGLDLDHKCRVRSCINPDHLEPVTNKENVLRGFGPTAMNSRKTHCKYGHELTPDNIYVVPTGRQCLACKRLLRKAEYQRFKAKKQDKQG